MKLSVSDFTTMPSVADILKRVDVEHFGKGVLHRTRDGKLYAVAANSTAGIAYFICRGCGEDYPELPSQFEQDGPSSSTIESFGASDERVSSYTIWYIPCIYDLSRI